MSFELTANNTPIETVPESDPRAHPLPPHKGTMSVDVDLANGLVATILIDANMSPRVEISCDVRDRDKTMVAFASNTWSGAELVMEMCGEELARHGITFGDQSGG